MTVACTVRVRHSKLCNAVSRYNRSWECLGSQEVDRVAESCRRGASWQQEKYDWFEIGRRRDADRLGDIE